MPGAAAPFAMAAVLLVPGEPDPPGPGPRSQSASTITTMVATRARLRATTIGRRRGSIRRGVAGLLDGQRPGHGRDRVDPADERVGPGLEGVVGVDDRLAAVDG